MKVGTVVLSNGEHGIVTEIERHAISMEDCNRVKFLNGDIQWRYDSQLTESEFTKEEVENSITICYNYLFAKSYESVVNELYHGVEITPIIHVLAAYAACEFSTCAIDKHVDVLISAYRRCQKV